MAYSENNQRIENCPFYVPSCNQFFHQMKKSYDSNQTNPFRAEALGHVSGFNLGVPGSINSYKQESYRPKRSKS